MLKYKPSHHQAISSALDYFSSEYLSENNIIFGGGTRIALEINEYRESVDIDFLCPNKLSTVHQLVDLSRPLANLVIIGIADVP
jgi:hypothetical protein